jgi:hypothetical protein
MATTKAKTGNIVDFDAAKLSGSLGNLDGSQLTNIRTIIKQSGNPSTSTNPTGGVGTMYVNTSNGATFCCTDSTTNANIWMNVGEGSGNIIQPTNPNDNFPDMQENTSVSHTFIGSSDDGNVVSHVISDISSDKLTVNDALVADGQPHVFNAGDVDADLNVTFIVKTIDNDGLYSTGRTITVTIHNDEIPVAPADNGSFPDLNKNDTYNHLFTGGTDDNGVTHYLVENISDAAVTVTNAEVAAGNAHSFVTTNVGADTSFTFTLKAKDTVGQYSTPVTYTSQVNNIVYTAATGGDNNSGNGTIDGDYKYHIFTNTNGGTFQVTQAPVATGNVEYLIVGGGGGGGGGNNGGGGGGGGDYVTGTFTPSVNSYAVVVGDGGPAQPTSATKGFDGNSSSIFGITAIGGGAGGGASDTPSIAQGGNGGSGGGGGCSNQPNMFGTQIGAGIGNNGGTPKGWDRAGGGGGAGSIGTGNPSIPHGGNGISNSIGGSDPFGAGHSYFAAGGGGGAAYGNVSNRIPGDGGNFGGGDGASIPANTGNGTAGQDGSGGGGGGGGYDQVGGFKGGDGIVIVKYKFQN